MKIKKTGKERQLLWFSLQSQVRLVIAAFDQIVTDLARNRFLMWLNYLLIFLVVLLVFSLTFYHDPHFDYDEANTLKIAAQSPAAIHQLLKNEQNLPSYYLLVHFLVRFFGGHGQVAVWFNFSVWLVSVVVFYALLRHFFSSRQSRFALTFYLLTPMIYHYAFYCRPYGLINLSFLLFLLAFLRYRQKQRWFSLIIFSCSTLLLSWLHLFSLLAVVLAGVIGLLMIENRRQRRVFLAFVFLSLASGLFFLLTKTDFHRIFLSAGTEYVRDHKPAFFDFFNLLFFYDKVSQLLLFDAPENFSLVLWLLGLYLIRAAAVNKQFYRKDSLILVALVVFYVLISFPFAAVFGRQRFLIFFAGPLLLTFFIGLASLPVRRARYLKLGLLAIFIFANLRMLTLFWSKEIGYYRHCLTFKNINQGVVVTSYTAYDAVTYCLDPEKVHLLLINGQGLTDTDQMSDSQILMFQAQSGGTMIENTNLRFRREFDRLLRSAQGRKETIERLAAATRDHDNLYLVYGNQGRVMPGDLQLAGENFRLHWVFNANVFWFRRR